MNFDDFRELMLKVKNGDKCPPLILIFTSEPYISSLSKRIIKNVIDPKQIEMDYMSMYGRESLSELIEYAKMPSFFGTHKYLVCTMDDKADGYTEVLLNKYTNENVDDASLIIIAAPENNAVLAKVKNAVNIKAILDDDMLNREVNTIIKKYGITDIDYKAKNLLIEKCAKSLSLINTEIQKIAAFKDSRITEELVSKLVPSNIEYKIYELTQALVRKNYQKTFEILRELINSGSKPMDLLGTIHRYYRQMLHASINKNMDNEELATLFGVSPGAVFYIKKSAEGYGQKQLKDIVDYMYDLQYKVVSGQRNAELILDSAISKLI